MSYYINAWLENGDPQLEIIDSRTRTVCMSWSYQAGNLVDSTDRNEIKRLFRDLVLLTCKQQADNLRVFSARYFSSDGENRDRAYPRRCHADVRSSETCPTHATPHDRRYFHPL